MKEEGSSGKRIFRTATPEERERHRLIRELIETELPEIKARARAHLDRLKHEGTPIRQLSSARSKA
jgi:hypothetical protein